MSSLGSPFLQGGRLHGAMAASMSEGKTVFFPSDAYPFP
jgi:hypothetical protein